MNKQKKILICPLDWGLGHATRCMPLIGYLLEKNCEVVVAGNEITNALIQAEFPALTYLPLTGYRVSYSHSKVWLPFKIGIQIPKLLRTIQYERKWLEEQIASHGIDIVISDNRYGLYSDKVPCIFITHQLQIAVPRSSLIEKMVNKINHRFINKFSAVWVPDYEDHTMAGKLSTKTNHLHTVRFIGNLSRFERIDDVPRKYAITFLLSGPEPQRTILEEIILKQIKNAEEPILLVRGKPQAEQLLHENSNVTIRNHLTKNDLQYAITESEIVVCRSGYSTIMDLIKLNKQALLIPTPGQTEQECLAGYLNEKGWFLASQQVNFDLKKEVQRMRTFSFNAFPKLKMDQFKSVIDDLL